MRQRLRVAGLARARRRRRSAACRAARRPCRSASGLRTNSATGISCVLARMRVRPWRTVASASARGADDHVAGQHRVGLLRVDAHLVQRARRVAARRTKRQHRAALLREAHEVEHAGALAFEVRGHRDQRADRDDAGAADAGDQQVVRAGPACGAGRRQRVDAPREVAPAPASAPTLLLQLAADHADEARAEALGARVVLVAAATGRSCACGPASVSSGSTATQLICTQQSPQPSQTRLVDEEARVPDRPARPSCGGGASRRRRSARRSAPSRPASRAGGAARRRARRGRGTRCRPGSWSLMRVVLARCRR